LDGGERGVGWRLGGFLSLLHIQIDFILEVLLNDTCIVFLTIQEMNKRSKEYLFFRLKKFLNVGIFEVFRTMLGFVSNKVEWLLLFLLLS
jgi:hypothetical protein